MSEYYEFDALKTIRSKYNKATTPNVTETYANQTLFDYETWRQDMSQIVEDIVDSNKPNYNDHCYYRLLIGMVDTSMYQYDVSDPNSEWALSSYEWPENFKYLEFLSERSLDIFFNFKGNIYDFFNVLSNLQDYESLFSLTYKPELKELFYYKGLSAEEIQMMILAIRSYTGEFSWVNNRILSHDIKSFFLNNCSNVVILSEITLLNSYFLKALYYIPIYFGLCSRCLNLTDEDVKNYKVGHIITWLQFSSSTVGEIPHESFFNTTNSVLIIYSVSGRNISEISKIKNEKEVVFLPLSQFLVLKRELKDNKNYIYVRQIELGFSEKNVLWIDNSIFYPESNIKQFIEYTSYLNPRIRFILKTSCQVALQYLNSCWGWSKKENLRIIVNSLVATNWHLGKCSSAEACVRFCYEIFRLGYNCELMIYTKDIQEVWQNITRYELSEYRIQVVNGVNEICRFITYE